MKIKNAFIARLLSCCLLVALVLTSGLGAISANAAEAPNIDNSISYAEATRSESTFASKNHITGEEKFYNLYNNGIKVDLSEEAEEMAKRSGETEKNDSPWFPTSASNVPENNQSRSLIDNTDGRTPVTTTTTYPYSAICTLVIYWPNGTVTEGGTAWMYWEDVAITAGHCVYDANRGGWAESIEVRPGANGSYSPYGVAFSTAIHTSTKWIEDSNWEYDYGVIELSSDIGNSTGWFGASWTIWSLKGTDVTITGYAGEYYRKMYTMSGEITKSATRKVYYNDIDTTPGQSGSPIYDADRYVVGIHAYGEGSYGNSGTRITSSLFDFFHSFREE